MGAEFLPRKSAVIQVDDRARDVVPMAFAHHFRMQGYAGPMMPALEPASDLEASHHRREEIWRRRNGRRE